MIGSSELIINQDGSVFHLHLKPEQIANLILLVGDPNRVNLIAEFFSNIESRTSNREFVSVTGYYKNKRITVISTGIGTDNIDIVMNELDALANIDFKTREIKEEKTSLKIIRIGTSGGIQDFLDVNSFVITQKAIGFDGLLNFYANRDEISDEKFEEVFKAHTNWRQKLASPYIVDCSDELFKKIFDEKFTPGITISAPGFYGPQGRVLRLQTATPDLNDRIKSFSYQGNKITNFEMECSAIYGLSALMGHQALTVCLIIANRLNKEVNNAYLPKMKELIKLILDRSTS